MEGWRDGGTGGQRGGSVARRHGIRTTHGNSASAIPPRRQPEQADSGIEPEGGDVSGADGSIGKELVRYSADRPYIRSESPIGQTRRSPPGKYNEIPIGPASSLSRSGQTHRKPVRKNVTNASRTSKTKSTRNKHHRNPSGKAPDRNKHGLLRKNTVEPQGLPCGSLTLQACVVRKPVRCSRRRRATPAFWWWNPSRAVRRAAA